MIIITTHYVLKLDLIGWLQFRDYGQGILGSISSHGGHGGALGQGAFSKLEVLVCNPDIMNQVLSL